MPRSTRFGMEFKLQKYQEARMGDRCNPKMVSFLFDQYWGRADKTIQTYEEVDGSSNCGAVGVTHPRTIVDVKPEGVYLDEVVDLEDAVDAKVWRATAYNSNAYRENIKMAIIRGCDAWAKQDFVHVYRADHAGMEVLDHRPNG